MPNTPRHESPFSDLIHARRRHLRLDQYHVAEACGISKYRLQQYEDGRFKYPPPPDRLNALSAALDLPTADLLQALGYTIESAA